MTISLILVIILLFLVSVYTLKIKDIANPLFLFLLPLFAQMIIYYIVYREFYPITAKTIIIWWIGITGFILGNQFFNYLGYDYRKKSTWRQKKN